MTIGQRDSDRRDDPAEGSPIVFRLDPGSGVPTYLQLVQQVEQALLLGYLSTGDQLPKVRDALLYDQHRITVPADVADKARRAIERMVSIGGGAKQPLSPSAEGVDPGE